ncbi:MAG TPA: HAD-IC family P-type ATPase [Gemmatimonadales bacterium]|nr:HAD-IC family P-type ATPase [Gemmatimonadales bacterium]
MPDSPYHARPSDDALRELESRPEGLTGAEAAERLGRVGPNELRVIRPVSAWRILIAQLKSVVVLLLAAACGVALAFGDLVDAAAIGAVLVINTLLGFVTELRARRAMESLRDLETPKALVLRDGKKVEIESRTVVPGDVLELEEGRSVPADARLLSAADLRMNEAPLTGESAPVVKQLAPLPPDTPLADRINSIYKGTTVAAGTGQAVVVATGMGTELGRIGQLVEEIEDERTPLERRLDTLGRRMVWLALAIGAVVIGIGALYGQALGRLIETGIALAVASIPEGLPATATIALAVGVRRMAKRHALVRRLPSVETLGSVTRVCTDKTGTLTAGQMTVQVLWVAGREVTISGTGYAPEGKLTEKDREVSAKDDAALRLALTIGALANRAEVTQAAEGWTVRGDATDAALLVAARKAGLEREALLREQPETGMVPFSSERMLMATFHTAGDRSTQALVKGAPGKIIELSTRMLEGDGEKPLDEAGRARLLETNRELASRGLRVIALASAPVSSTDESALTGLGFVGLAGIIDPPAEGVQDTIRSFNEAGIRTVMITGDQQLTAEAIARELGILQEGQEVMSGKDLAQVAEPDRAARLERVAAFSRVSPEDKLTIITTYQDAGGIVAMLGDGVNDAAALKKADVGVAMGKRGTDVAKEVAAVVLQDDRFPTIAAAVEEGRVIFDNIRKFVFYLFSCNLAEVVVLLGATVAGGQAPLLPVQILWLNLVTDTFPALALALEPAEPDIMRRPPRDPDEAILSASFLKRIAAYAVLIAAATLGGYAWALSRGDTDPRRAMTVAFMTLAFAQLFHLLNARRRGPAITPRHLLSNRWALGAVALVTALQIVSVHLPPLAAVLGTVPLPAGDWMIVLGLAAIPAALGQGFKLVRKTGPA